MPEEPCGTGVGQGESETEHGSRYGDPQHAHEVEDSARPGQVPDHEPGDQKGEKGRDRSGDEGHDQGLGDRVRPEAVDELVVIHGPGVVHRQDLDESADQDCRVAGEDQDDPGPYEKEHGVLDRPSGHGLDGSRRFSRDGDDGLLARPVLLDCEDADGGDQEHQGDAAAEATSPLPATAK